MSSISRRLHLAGLALVCFTTMNAQPLIPTGYVLDVALRPAEHMMTACAEVFFNPADPKPQTLVFYLHGELKIDSVVVGTSRVPHREQKIFYYLDYSLVANAVQVDLPAEPLTSARITYSGYCSPSRARSLSDYMRIDDDGVFLRGYGYSLWFPVFVQSGEPPYSSSFHKVRIRTPRQYQSVFVGAKIADVEEGEERITEWSSPSVSILDVQLSARQYHVTRNASYYCYALENVDAQSRNLAVLEFTKRLDSLYASRYRSASADREVYILQLPHYGDIASGNVVGISDEHWRDFRPASDAGRTIAHELVHSYVQIPTPMSSPMYALIVEGFPSYFHYPVLAEILGEEFYQSEMAAVERAYLRRKSTGKTMRGETLPVEKPILDIRADEISAYKDVFVLNDRVRLFFDYVRRRLGPERFRAFGKDLFHAEALDYDTFQRIFVEYFPGGSEDLGVWMRSNAYPERFRREGEPQGLH